VRRIRKCGKAFSEFAARQRLHIVEHAFDDVIE